MRDVSEVLMQEWTAFKAENDKRLAEIEKKGHARAESEEKVTRIERAVNELQAQVDEAHKKAQRVTVSGGEPNEKQGRASADYKKSFRNFLRNGRPDDLMLSNQVETGDDTKGGYLLPSETDSEIEKYERDNTPMRQMARVITTSNENYEKLVKQGQAASGWEDAEADARAGDDTTATWALLRPYFGAVFSEPYVTQKMVDDAGRDIQAELSEDVGVEFAEQENDAFTRGTGVKKPKGLLAYTTAETDDGTRAFDQLQVKKSGTNGDFDADDLIDLIHLVKRGYRQNGKFMLSNLTLAKIRKLKDGNSNYLWQPSIQAGAPGLILGYGYEENDDMPEVATDALPISFGDHRRAYTIIDVRGTRVIFDNLTTKGKIKLYHWKRVGGLLVNNRAVKLLKTSA